LPQLLTFFILIAASAAGERFALRAKDAGADFTPVL